MLCPKCAAENPDDATRCAKCSDSLSVAVLEVIRGEVHEKIRFLKPRSYEVGRARHNDIALNEPSISKLHARIEYQDGRFFIEDAGSMHGVYVNAAKVRRAELAPGAQVQLGNVTLKFSPLGSEGATGAMAKLPWVEQQQLLLQLVQTLNATLVLSPVLEQVTDAIMHITGAERGFLLLADSSPSGAHYPSVAGLRLRVARGRTDPSAANGHGISGPIVRRALETGEVVSTLKTRGEALAPPPARPEDDTRPVQTVVCLPLRSPRGGGDGSGRFPRALGVLYVDNAGSSEPFSSEALRAAEALARHAALAIENAQLFEREQHTIEELQKAQKQLLQSESSPPSARWRRASRTSSTRRSPTSWATSSCSSCSSSHAVPGRDAVVDRARRRPYPLARPPAARLQPARARGDDAALAQRRDRAQPRAVPVSDRRAQTSRSRRRSSRSCRACWASRTSWRRRSSTWW